MTNTTRNDGAMAVGRASATPPGSLGTRASRAAALTGVLFVVTMVGANVLTASAPSTDDSTAKISHYYLTHTGQFGGSAILTILAAISGISFAMYLRTYFRRFVPDWMTSLFFTGVLIVAISGTLTAGINFVLTDHPQLLSSDSLRLLNTIRSQLNWSSLAVGLTITYAAVAMIIRSAGTLPKWLGWVSWLMAALAASYFLSFIPLIFTAVVGLITSVRMAQRNPDVSAVIRL